MMRELIQSKAVLFFLLFILCCSSCTKVDYTEIKDPAYLRVFNNLNYLQTMGNKDEKLPYFCLLINPTVEADGTITGGEIVGDFLNKRDAYAPPYPSHIGNSTTVDNPEFPGKQNVLVAPVLNGFDLSSWAQVPSGDVRVIFAYRPKNEIPFLKLEKHLRQDILIDTVLNLGSKEVYTMHLLQTDFNTKAHGLVVRQENFHKLPLSDSLVYVNFYNMSAKGFVDADASLKDNDYRLRSFKGGIQDEMNVYFSLYETEANLTHNGATIPGFKGRYLTKLKRETNSAAVSPYMSFPLWASTLGNRIYTPIWQRFEFLAPGIDITANPIFPSESETGGNWAVVNCLRNGRIELQSRDNGTILPNLLVNVHSGINNPQTFATVNTIEVVNGRVYLTTIQRKYPAPIY